MKKKGTVLAKILCVVFLDDTGKVVVETSHFGLRGRKERVKRDIVADLLGQLKMFSDLISDQAGKEVLRGA